MTWYLLLCAGTFGSLSCAPPSPFPNRQACEFFVTHYRFMGRRPSDGAEFVNAKCVQVATPRAPEPNPPSISR